MPIIITSAVAVIVKMAVPSSFLLVIIVCLVPDFTNGTLSSLVHKNYVKGGSVDSVCINQFLH